jgi:hypothetical protein
MRTNLVFLTLVLASGALVAAGSPDTYNWLQLQGGVTGHHFNNPGANEPALGLGVGTWINRSWGVEASALGTHVDYGYGKAKEAQAFGSVLFNPFATPSNVRPFLRLGLGADTTGHPVSGNAGHTTHLAEVAGVGAQFLSEQEAS